jgi:hypothetical protein
MSLDLIVLPKESASDVAEALAVYLGTRDGVPAAESLQAFAEEVAARFEKDGRWPWTGPIDLEDTHAVLHPAHEWWEEVIGEVASIAARHGLVTLDPQASAFVPAGGYKIDPTRRWDILVVDPSLPAWPKRLREIRDSGDSGIDAQERLQSFIAEADGAFGSDAWQARISSTAAVLSIPLARWEEVAGPLAEIAERHGLRAWVPDGNPRPASRARKRARLDKRFFRSLAMEHVAPLMPGFVALDNGSVARRDASVPICHRVTFASMGGGDRFAAYAEIRPDTLPWGAFSDLTFELGRWIVSEPGEAELATIGAEIAARGLSRFDEFRDYEATAEALSRDAPHTLSRTRLEILGVVLCGLGRTEAGLRALQEARTALNQRERPASSKAVEHALLDQEERLEELLSAGSDERIARVLAARRERFSRPT